MMKIKRVIDISRPIFKGMTVWPFDQDVNVQRVCSISEGYVCNLTQMSFVVHAGTHIDAPCHFIDKGLDIGSLDLKKFCGMCK
ncbi:cyclase family protein, partial [Cutibacterium acnes]